MARGAPIAECKECGVKRPIRKDGICFGCVSKNRKAPFYGHKWTAAEDAQLRLLWATLAGTVPARANRVAAIAVKMGLTYGTVLWRAEREEL